MRFVQQACCKCNNQLICKVKDMLKDNRALNNAMIGCKFFVNAENEIMPTFDEAETSRRNVSEDAMDISAAIHEAAGDKIEEPELVPGQTCHICGKEGEAYICSQCGAFVCPDCATETLDGKVLCPDCF